MRKISLLLLALTFFNCTEKEAPKNVTVSSNPIEGGTVAPSVESITVVKLFPLVLLLTVAMNF